MGIIKLSTICLLVASAMIILVSGETETWEMRVCHDNCQEQDYHDFMNGTTICSTPKNYPGPQPPCSNKCYERPVPDEATQRKCFCQHCKNVNGAGYCGRDPEDPDELGGNIFGHECEEKVCNAETPLKYHGMRCGPPPEGWETVGR